MICKSATPTLENFRQPSSNVKRRKLCGNYLSSSSPEANVLKLMTGILMWLESQQLNSHNGCIIKTFGLWMLNLPCQKFSGKLNFWQEVLSRQISVKVKSCSQGERQDDKSIYHKSQLNVHTNINIFARSYLSFSICSSMFLLWIVLTTQRSKQTYALKYLSALVAKRKKIVSVRANSTFGCCSQTNKEISLLK